MTLISARPSGLVSAVTALLAAALLLFAGAGAADAKPKVKVKIQVVTTSQADVARSGQVTVKVTSNGKTSVNLSGASDGRNNLFKGQAVKFSKKGTKTVKLALNSTGRSVIVANCKNHAVAITGKYGKSKAVGKRTLSKGSCVKVNLGPDPANCDWLDPTVCLQPFANDYFTKSDPDSETGLMLNLGAEATPENRDGDHIDVTDMNRGDGFSPGNVITLKIPGMDTPAAFENSGIVPLTDLEKYDDPNQAVVVLNAATGERHPIWAELDSNPTTIDPGEGSDGGVNLDPTNTEDVNLIIRPQRNFEHGERYIVVLRNLKNAQNKTIQSPLAFRVYRDKIGTDQGLVEGRRSKMESIIGTAVSEGGVARSSLYMAWDFTVASAESVTGRAVEIRDDAFARLGDTDLSNNLVEGTSPNVTVTGITNNPNGSVLRRIDGNIEVPCYLTSNNCAPGGVFQFNSDNELIWTEGKTASFPWRCQIPKNATAANPTTTGTYGHGLLGSLTQIGAQTEVGLRSNTTWCAVDWAGFSSADLANVISSLRDMSNFNKLVDRMQQGFVNFMYLQRALIHPDGMSNLPAFQDGDGTTAGESLIDLSEGDATRGQYMGISQGGIMGGALTPLSPDVDYGVLGVPGINYSTLLRRSVDSDQYFKDDSFGLYKNYPDFGNRMVLLSLMQLLWDRGEGNGYAHFIGGDRALPDTTPKEVLYRVAYSDHQVANFAAEVAARTVGAAVYMPALRPGRHWEEEPFYEMEKVTEFPWNDGSMLVYYDSGTTEFTGTRGVGVRKPPTENVPPRPEWGYGRDPHGDPRASEAGITHAIEFLNGPDLDGEDRGWVRGCLDITGLSGDLAPEIPARLPGDNHCYANGWNGFTEGN
jgi:archaellum component FlaF (FlaF/FlaG flagellin family)